MSGHKYVKHASKALVQFQRNFSDRTQPINVGSQVLVLSIVSGSNLSDASATVERINTEKCEIFRRFVPWEK